MKILFISTIFPNKNHPDYGTYVRNIYKLYIENGHEVELITFTRSGGKIKKIINLFSFYKEILIKVTQSDKYDLINVQYPYFATIPLYLKLKSIKKPLIVTVHGSDVFYNSFTKKFFDFFTKKLLEKATKIIVSSNFFKSKMIDCFDYEENKYFVCPPGGFDENIFYPMEQYIKLSNLTDINNKTKWIGFAGRLVSGKGWKTLLDAFIDIAKDKRFEYINLVYAGNGEDSAEIARYIDLQKINDRVKLIGSLSQKELSIFYNSIDLFVFPTHFEESLGLVGIESLACGVPIIASKIGGIIEYVKHDENGFLVQPNNSTELTKYITEYFLKSDSKKIEMSESAVKSVERYKSRIVADRLELLLNELR